MTPGIVVTSAILKPSVLSGNVRRDLAGRPGRPRLAGDVGRRAEPSPSPRAQNVQPILRLIPKSWVLELPAGGLLSYES